MSMCRWQVSFHISKERALLLLFLERQVKIQLLMQETHGGRQKEKHNDTSGRKGATELLENLEGDRS